MNKKYYDKTNIVILAITILSVAFSILILVGVFKVSTKNILNLVENDFPIPKNKVHQIYSNIDDYSITLKYKDKEWVYTKEDFILNTNIHTVLDSLHTQNLSTLDYSTTKDTITTMKEKGVEYKNILNYIFLGLDYKLKEVVEYIEYNPIDSILTFTGQKNKLFEISNSKNGIKVDMDSLYYLIGSKFLESNEIILDIPTIDILPKITYEDNMSNTHKISTFTTNVADSTGGRKENVRLALSKLNGTTIAPHEEVSFNKITGPHTAETGYKPAIVILNQEYVEDIGGGVCQASTTLYNALLTAGVKILEANKHSLPVKYVPLALDAMVSEGISDLRFVNNSEYPIFIHTYTDPYSATVEIYSHSLPNNISYKTRSETIREIEPGYDKIIPDEKLEYTNKVLFKGEYYRLKNAKVGYEAIGYLDTYKDGVLIKSEKIRHEIYKPQTGVVIEGVAEPIENMVVIDNGVVINN